MTDKKDGKSAVDKNKHYLERKGRNHKNYKKRLEERGLKPAVVVIPIACYDKLKEFAKKMRDEYKKD
jgi:hypothetical protein